MEALLISIGGGIGAVFRYSVGQLIGRHPFPWATLGVNGLGSFMFGVAIFGISDSGTLLLVGTGFCGAVTTYSSFSFQTVDLWERGKYKYALINPVANLGISFAGFTGAWLLFV